MKARLAIILGIMCFTFASPGLADTGFILPKAHLVTFRDCPDCLEMVVLPSALSMSRSTVTRAQFSHFAKETGFSQVGWGCSWTTPEFRQSDDDPVTCVSWADAQKFAEWVTKKTGHAYRLPTLEELKYAAMAGETGFYWWGQSVGVNRANCKGCGSIWDNAGTSPVASFKPNSYGIFDPVGNVWQWTGSCTTEQCIDHFLFGGSWASVPADLKVDARIWNDRNYRLNTYGIRLVRDAYN
jgi:formylglycine-generating enzyme required for sulfatase activity